MASNVSILTVIASFPSFFSDSCNIQGNLGISQFNSTFAVSSLFQDKRRSIGPVQVWQ